MNNSETETDLNTVELDECQSWIDLLEDVCAMQITLKENPNMKGLQQARTSIYNILANIQVLMDSV